MCHYNFYFDFYFEGDKVYLNKILIMKKYIRFLVPKISYLYLIMIIFFLNDFDIFLVLKII